MPLKKPMKKPAPRKPTPPPREEPVVEQVVAASSHLPIEGEAPPYYKHIEQYADELQRRNPEHIMTLDAGVFMWLWRIAETRATAHYNTPIKGPAVQASLEIALRACEAFRRSASFTAERVESTKVKPVKSWARKS